MNKPTQTFTLTALLLAPLAASLVQAAGPAMTDVFVAGRDGVHTYRIPAILLSPSGALLVFCEARKESIRDASPTDMVLKRSDDGGKSWRMGQPVDQHTNESQVVELADGRLMLNMRQGTGQSCRAVAISKDGGETWEPVFWDRALNECPCQASILRHSCMDKDGRSIIAFANPDISGDRYGVVERTKMTVRLSFDEARTWPVKKRIHAGPSSYSGLVRFPDGDLGLVFEGGERHRREWVRFARLPLEWITEDAK